MSISSQLLILNQTKKNIKQAINLKGVSVTNEAFAEYPDKVRQIPSGSGTYESNIIQYIEGTMVDVEIPYGTTTIGKSAFYFMPIETVTIPNSVTAIGSFSFCNCQNLGSVTIPNSVTIIGNSAFHGCVSLSTMDIPNSVTSLGDGVFRGCTGLISATLGSGITSIGDYIFYECDNFQSLTCLAVTPPTIVSGTFQSGNYPIYVPDNSVLAYQTADNWMQYSNRIKPLSDKPQ
ncbi:MAG: leucine-rich repeat domain-containing protein [Prevotella sp.]|nr:leucine-rich repeat domain-containing protein [Prevotella sp.]MBQ2167797.1 leucine-rich repeat domain-containing protein [Prevotella sp.]